MAAAFLPIRSQRRSFSLRPASSGPEDVVVDARRLRNFEELKETFVSLLNDIDQRQGAYAIQVPATHLADLAIFVESEFPWLVCEDYLDVRDGVARLRWDRP